MYFCGRCYLFVKQALLTEVVITMERLLSDLSPCCFVIEALFFESLFLSFSFNGRMITAPHATRSRPLTNRIAEAIGIRAAISAEEDAFFFSEHVSCEIFIESGSQPVVITEVIGEILDYLILEHDIGAST